jgi:hypothetical protein
MNASIPSQITVGDLPPSTPIQLKSAGYDLR